MKYKDNEPYRLIHDDDKVLALIQAGINSETYTAHKYFSGTKQECIDEINRLKLTVGELCRQN